MTRQRGVSLVELIMFIVIVSVALAGILLVMNVTTRGSADPLIHKQSLAIAESILEEIELMPFTFCDPDDATASTATGAGTGAGECTIRIENLGLDTAFGAQPANETRYSLTSPFDNVNDYHNFSMPANSILDITGANTGVNGYTLDPIIISTIATLPGIALADDVLQIRVSVTGPDGVAVVLDGIRTRYAPRAVP